MNSHDQNLIDFKNSESAGASSEKLKSQANKLIDLSKSKNENCLTEKNSEIVAV
jgi:hypothetical protein